MKIPSQFVWQVTGAAAVETSLALGFLAISLSTALSAVGMSAAYFWSDHVLYETLICLAEGQSETTCRGKATRKLDRSLPFCSLGSLSLSAEGGRYAGVISVVFPNRGKQEIFTVRRVIRVDNVLDGLSAKRSPEW